MVAEEDEAENEREQRIPDEVDCKTRSDNTSVTEALAETRERYLCEDGKQHDDEKREYQTVGETWHAFELRRSESHEDACEDENRLVPLYLHGRNASSDGLSLTSYTRTR